MFSTDKPTPLRDLKWWLRRSCSPKLFMYTSWRVITALITLPMGEQKPVGLGLLNPAHAYSCVHAASIFLILVVWHRPYLPGRNGNDANGCCCRGRGQSLPSGIFLWRRPGPSAALPCSRGTTTFSPPPFPETQDAGAKLLFFVRPPWGGGGDSPRAGGNTVRHGVSVGGRRPSSLPPSAVQDSGCTDPIPGKAT